MLLLGASAAAAASPQSDRRSTGAQQSAPSPFAQLRPPVAVEPDRGRHRAWNSLRQSDSLPFSSYATFLLGHRGWPGEAAMRRVAERRLSLEAASPGEVVALLRRLPAADPGGHAQHAFALAGDRPREEAREAARRRLDGGVLPPTDEQRLLGRVRRRLRPGRSRPADGGAARQWRHGRARRGASMWAPPREAGPVRDAARAADPRAPTRRAGSAALDPRCAARRRPDRSTRRTGCATPARAPRRGNCSPRAAALDRPPAKPARWLETALTLARGAANDRNWSTAYGIASQARRPLSAPAPTSATGPMASATIIRASPGSAGPPRCTGSAGPPTRRACSISTPAPRARRRPAPRASTGPPAPPPRPAMRRRPMPGSSRRRRAPDQFYGQLALERLGRARAAAAGACPPPTPPSAPPSPRAPLAEAVRYLGMVGRRGDQTPVHPRAGRSSCDNDRERAIGRRVRPADRPARSRRLGGARGARRAARTSTTAPPSRRSRSRPLMRATGRSPTASSARKARSSGPRSASAGARGLMQLMPGTARQVGAPGRRSLRSRPADRGPAIQYPARQPLSVRADGRMGRQCGAGRGRLQCRQRQRPALDRAPMAIRACPAPTCCAGSRTSPSPRRATTSSA